MLPQTLKKRRRERYENFAKQDNQPQIQSNLINTRIPENRNIVCSYWLQRKMTSAGTPLNKENDR